MADYILPETAKFYFFARQIIQDATSLFFEDGKKEPPTTDEYRLLEIAFRCIEQDKCDLIAALGSDLPKGHPHPIIREQLVTKVLSRNPANETDRAMQMLSAQMLRNARYLWSELDTNLRSPNAVHLIEGIRNARKQLK